MKKFISRFKYVVLGSLIMVSSVTYAVQISVPAASNGGQMLISPSAGNYQASSTQTGYFGNYVATSTRPSVFPYASSTAISAATLCFTGDTCRTTWPTSSSGSGNVSTSSSETSGFLSYWTSNSATPALLGKVATSSIGAGTGLTFSGTAGAQVGGTNGTYSVNTSQNITTLSNLSTAGTVNTTSSGGLYSTATSSLSVGASLSTSGTLGALISGTNSSLSINTGNTNTWSVLQNFLYSSTTGYASFALASSTLHSIGTLTLPNISGTQCLHSISGVVSGTGSDCGSGGSFTNTLANGGTATTTFYNGGIVFSDSTKLTQSASTENFFWDETNKRLGLGTSTPFAKLSINPAAGETAFVIGSSTATSFIVDKNGAVLIGTATLASSALNKFEISGGGIGLDNNKNISWKTAAGTMSNVMAVNASNAFSFRGLGGGVLIASGGGTNLVTITDGGNFGIGSTTPGSLLSIGNAGGINIIPTATSTWGSSANGLNLTNGCYAIGGTCIGSGSGSGSGTVNSGLSGQIAYYASNGTAVSASSTLFMASNQRIGVGTTTPLASFHVSGTSTSLPSAVIQATSSQTSAILDVWSSAGVSRFNVQPDGSIAIGTSTPLIGLGQFQISTSTGAGFKPQLILSDQSATTNQKHINFVSRNDVLTIGTSTDAYATSTNQALILNMTPGTSPGLQVATGTETSAPTTALINLGVNGVSGSASTTIHTAKLQLEGVNSAGAMTCAYFVGATLVVQSGSCNN